MEPLPERFLDSTHKCNRHLSEKKKVGGYSFGFSNPSKAEKAHE
jgi:hypothetical protein